MRRGRPPSPRDVLAVDQRDRRVVIEYSSWADSAHHAQPLCGGRGRSEPARPLLSSSFVAHRRLCPLASSRLSPLLRAQSAWQPSLPPRPPRRCLPRQVLALVARAHPLRLAPPRHPCAPTLRTARALDSPTSIRLDPSSPSPSSCTPSRPRPRPSTSSTSSALSSRPACPATSSSNSVLSLLPRSTALLRRRSRRPSGGMSAWSRFSPLVHACDDEGLLRPGVFVGCAYRDLLSLSTLCSRGERLSSEKLRSPSCCGDISSRRASLGPRRTTPCTTSRARALFEPLGERPFFSRVALPARSRITLPARAAVVEPRRSLPCQDVEPPLYSCFSRSVAYTLSFFPLAVFALLVSVAALAIERVLRRVDSFPTSSSPSPASSSSTSSSPRSRTAALRFCGRVRGGAKHSHLASATTSSRSGLGDGVGPTGGLKSMPLPLLGRRWSLS